jgi:alpha-tubulin suppressor-like RCC1 family protein
VAVAEGSLHSIGVTAEGKAYSWGRSNAVGQLGREDGQVSARQPGEVPIPTKVSQAFCSRGCAVGSGHSALIDQDGRLWMAGCDRWQQLGLGSANGGNNGYTWIGGKLWQDRFVPSTSVVDLIKSPSTTIRDVALGGDHTIILSSNQRDVYVFGKGGDGQLGMVGKPFVSAPVKSKILSEDQRGELLSAVCAVQNCSATLDTTGKIRQQAGKCRAVGVHQELQDCITRAKLNGLVQEYA